MKRFFLCLTALMLLLCGCQTARQEEGGTKIHLSNDSITVDGKAITNDDSQPVYSANDIVFYLAGQGFTYGEGEEKDEHDQAEADAHTVVHITKPGRYVLSGKLSLGQIAVDLGDNAKKDPKAVVTLILNGVDITCTVAPGVIFYNVYECGDKDDARMDVDTAKAGANVVIADGTENTVNGAYVAKIYKSYQLNNDGTKVVDSKKLHKYDGAFYSKMSMNISGGKEGTGILNINAENEGLDSELHLTLNGGTININAGNDGINTNEDGVSVTTVNGGTLNILCNGLSGEGDGIDSNGWLVINGGTVLSQACATSADAGIDSDNGIYINGGKVVATGNMLDKIAGGEQTYAVFQFASRQNGGKYALKDASGKVAGEYTLANAFTYLIVAEDALKPGDYTFWQGDTQLSASLGGMGGGMGGMMPPDGQRPEMPEGGFPGGMQPPEKPNGDMGQRPEMPDGNFPQMPDGMTPPDGFGDFPGGMPGGTMASGGESSTTFPIQKGGNQFGNISPAS